MPEDLQKLIEKVDALPSRKWFILYHRILARISRIVLLFLGIGLIGYGYYVSRIAEAAAVANFLDLSVALQSLSVSTLALVLAILALISNEEWKRADDLKFEERIFNSMKANTNPILLRGLLRIKMRLPRAISLQLAHKENPELFTEKELVRRLLES